MKTTQFKEEYDPQIFKSQQLYQKTHGEVLARVFNTTVDLEVLFL